MNKIFVPKITFKEICSEEKKVEAAYARVFEIARRNIISRKTLCQLTNVSTPEYIKVYNGVTV
jgi:hypothetical protein